MNENLELKDPKPEMVVSLYSGKYLNLEEALKHCLSRITKVIILAGPPECGKTTILAFLNNILQKGPYNGLYFAGSKTLVQFEECSFLSRISSGNFTADTFRTTIRDIQFLHLDLFKNDTKVKHSFLFTDLNGERFNDIKDSSEECKKFSILKRCDSISILFDGEKLAHPKTRYKTKVDGVTLLRNCLDSDMLSNNSYVDIVISKYDLIKNNSDAEMFITEMYSDIEDKFSKRLGKLSIMKICARSKNTEVIPTGYGIDKLLDTWVLNEILAMRKSKVQAKFELSNRAFLNFGFNKSEPGLEGAI